MIELTNDEQITVVAMIETMMDNLIRIAGNEDGMFGKIALNEVVNLSNIRRKVNEERKKQGRIEL